MQKKPTEKQIQYALQLTGLPREDLEKRSREEISDLINTAKKNRASDQEATWVIRFEELNRLWEAHAPVGAIVECFGQNNPKHGQAGLVVHSAYDRRNNWRGVVIVWPPHYTGVSFSTSPHPTDWKILEPPDDETRALAGFLRHQHNYKIPCAEMSRLTTIDVQKIKALPWRVLSRLCCSINAELNAARQALRYFPLGTRVRATETSHPHANQIGKVLRHEPEAFRCIVAWDDGVDTESPTHSTTWPQ